MFDEGMQLFHDGAYDRAAVKMMGAAQSNESNAACRLHAAHSLFALGQYRRAAAYLARAFELSPSLPYKSYDIRDEYGRTEDFEKQIGYLRLYVQKHPRDDTALTVLGYVTYYTTGPAASYPALRRAAALNPGSYFIPKLLNVAAQTVPQDESLTPVMSDRRESPSPAPIKSRSMPKSGTPSPRRWVKV
jgi:tetratricopeptide (TPR) repeat protein